jgi:hypothetical protein
MIALHAKVSKIVKKYQIFNISIVFSPLSFHYHQHRRRRRCHYHNHYHHHSHNHHQQQQNTI